MDTCFIFIKQLSEEQFLSTRINIAGQLVQDLKLRSQAELYDLQENAKTIVVLPSTEFSIHYVELPWLGEKKAAQALPYALEDSLAESIDDLHFAFDKQHYQAGKYLVIVGKKSYLEEVLTKLAENSIKFSELCLDWFALNEYEAFITDSNLLVNDPAVFFGALAPFLAEFYIKKEDRVEVLRFKDSIKFKPLKSAKLIEKPYHAWLAERLLKQPRMNLCQGSFQQKTSKSKALMLNYIAGGAVLLWLLVFALSSIANLHSLSKQLDKTNAEIAKIYHQFFPDAKQIINPRVRISQELKLKSGAEESSFWSLLNSLTLALKAKNSQVESLNFQNQVLIAALICPDFATLEAIEISLQKTAIQVKQSQAAVHDGKVRATLELRL